MAIWVAESCKGMINGISMIMIHFLTGLAYIECFIHSS